MLLAARSVKFFTFGSPNWCEVGLLLVLLFIYFI